MFLDLDKGIAEVFAEETSLVRIRAKVRAPRLHEDREKPGAEKQEIA